MSDQTSDTFDAKIDRIAEQVDAIARFVGRSAELQVQTQLKLDQMMEQTQTKFDQIMAIDRQTHVKLDRISADIAELTTAIREQGAELTRSIREQNTELTRSIREQNTAINGYQEVAKEQARSTAELIKLVTILTSKAS